MENILSANRSNFLSQNLISLIFTSTIATRIVSDIEKMRKIGDKLSMAMLVFVCGGTLVALGMTSAAKKAGLTGVPPSSQRPSSPDKQHQDFQDRLKALEKL